MSIADCCEASCYARPRRFCCLCMRNYRTPQHPLQQPLRSPHLSASGVEHILVLLRVGLCRRVGNEQRAVELQPGRPVDDGLVNLRTSSGHPAADTAESGPSSRTGGAGLDRGGGRIMADDGQVMCPSSERGRRQDGPAERRGTEGKSGEKRSGRCPGRRRRAAAAEGGWRTSFQEGSRLFVPP